MRILPSALALSAVLSAALLAAPLAAAEAPAPEAAGQPAGKTADLFPDRVIAKGTGVEIKRSQLDDAVVTVKANIAAQGRTLTPDESLGVDRQVLDRLIQIQLLLAKATDADKAQGRELSQKRFAEAKKRAGSPESFERQLKAAGLTEAMVSKRMTEEATAETVLERELKINVTDDDVKQFYDENPAKFEQPETVRAAHVLIGTRDHATGAELSDEAKKAKLKLAQDIQKRAKAGEDFTKLARDYSDDPGSKDKGGEYTFARGQMVPEFESAAFALGTNQVSDIVTTSYGYHVIKLYEKFPAKKLELAKVSDDIRQFLKARQVQKLLPPYMEKLRKDAHIEILDDSLKPAGLAAETPKSESK